MKSKKTLVILLAMAFVVVIVAGFGVMFLLDDTTPEHEHTVVVDAAVAATCGESGLTEGSHCSVCGEVIVAQEKVAAKGHDMKGGACTVCGLRVSVGLEYAQAADGSYYISSVGSCKDLVLVMPDTIDGHKMEAIGEGAFKSCWDIVSVTIPAGIVSIGEDAFWGCWDLESIIIPEGVVSIGESAFGFCESLERVKLPSTLVTIENTAFGWCESLVEIAIPASVTNIGTGAFNECFALESIVVEKGNAVYESSGDCLIEKETKTLLLACNNSVLPCDGSITEIRYNAFDGCNAIKALEIPASVTRIGVGALAPCTSLETLTVQEGNPVYSSSGNCLIERATRTLLFGCETGEFPTDGSVTKIGSSAFSGCDWIVDVMLPDCVKEIGTFAFSDCPNLKRVIISASVVEIGYGAFTFCESLSSIEVDEGNAIYHSDDNCLIDTYGKTLILGCKNSVIPTNGSVTAIGASAFSACMSIEEMVVPEGITMIDDHAFSNCISLESVTLPDTLEFIGDSVFAYCDALTSIRFEGTVEQWEALAKGSGWDSQTGEYTVYCSNGNVSK